MGRYDHERGLTLAAQPADRELTFMVRGFGYATVHRVRQDRGHAR